MTNQTKKTIPKNLNKEAQYWEENFDASWKKGTPTKAKVAPELSRTLTISLKPSITKSVFKEASKKGTDPIQLVTHWIQEKTKTSQGARSV